MIRRPPRSTQSRSSAASDVYKRQLRILVVFFHEMSHGLAALLTGGGIRAIHLHPEAGGMCVTTGGIPFLVISAGYLGSLVWGGALMLLSRKSRWANPLTAAFPVISVGLMLGKPWALRAFKTLAYVVASLSLFGLMAKALPWFTQVNGDSIALFLPVWFGLAAGPIVHQIRNKRIARPKDASAPDSSGGPQDVGTQHSPKA